MDYELKLPQQDVQLILNALAELPYKVSAAAYDRIKAAVIAQNDAVSGAPGTAAG